MRIEHKTWTETDRLLERSQEINEICDDVTRLNEIYLNLSSIVSYQNDSIENITFHSTQAKEKTKDGVEHLEKAKKYQHNYKLPLIGGFIGAAVAGPIGAAAGLKWFSLLTAGGGFLFGGTVGSFLR